MQVIFNESIWVTDVSVLGGSLSNMIMIYCQVTRAVDVLDQMSWPVCLVLFGLDF